MGEGGIRNDSKYSGSEFVHQMSGDRHEEALK